MRLTLVGLQAIFLALLALLWRRPGVSRLLLILALFTFGMWYATPTVTNTLFWKELAPHPVARYDDFAQTALLETAVFLAALCVLLLKHPYWATVRNLGPVSAGGWGEVALIAAAAVADAAVLVGSSRLQGESYSERNSYLVVKLQTHGFGTVGVLFLIETALSALVVAMILARRPAGLASRVVCWIGSLWLGWRVVYELLLGSRLSLLAPVIVVVLFGEVQRWPIGRRLWTTGVVACLSVVVGGVLSVAVSRERGSKELTVAKVVAESTNLVEQAIQPPVSASDNRRPTPAPAKASPPPPATAPAKKGVAWSIVQEIGTKFDSISGGRVLLNHYGVGQGGWRPYWGAGLALVPRAVLRSKPVPGSRDGTFGGHPSRLVSAVMGLDPVYANVGVSPAAIALWQLGWAGLALLIVSNAAQLVLLNSLLLGESVLTRGVALFVICIPSLVGLFASPDVILMNVQRALAACLVLAAVSRLWSSSSRRVGAA